MLQLLKAPKSKKRVRRPIEPADLMAMEVVRWVGSINHYPSDIQLHGRRNAFLCDAVGPEVEKWLNVRLDYPYMWALNECHDHLETYEPLGDVPAWRKANMTPAEKAALTALEMEALEDRVRKCPERFRGYLYEPLLNDAYFLHSLPSCLAKWKDRVDCYCETQHEIRSGNMYHARPRLIDGVEIEVAAIDFEERYFITTQRKLTKLAWFFHNSDSPLTKIPKLRSRKYYEELGKRGKPHTLASIEEQIRMQENPMYSTWLKVMLDSRDPEILAWLINPVIPVTAL